MEFKTTSEQEAAQIIERDLFAAMDSLKQKGLERTDKNLLNEFAEVLQDTLTKHFQDIRLAYQEIENRTNELQGWLDNVNKMIDALHGYKKQIDEDALNTFSTYVDKVKNEVISRFHAALKPSNN